MNVEANPREQPPRELTAKSRGSPPGINFIFFVTTGPRTKYLPWKSYDVRCYSATVEKSSLTRLVNNSIKRFCYLGQLGASRCNSVHFSRYLTELQKGFVICRYMYFTIFTFFFSYLNIKVHSRLKFQM